MAKKRTKRPPSRTQLITRLWRAIENAKSLDEPNWFEVECDLETALTTVRALQDLDAERKANA